MKIWEFLVIAFCFIVFMLWIVAWSVNCKNVGYIEACEDFYHGKLKYDRIVHKDGTVEWKKVDF